MNLTSQQRAALDVVGASVVLATGAGCGKTRVLTEKYVEALSTRRIPVGRMVALTFTDKAAAELRRRVRQACRERLDAGEDRRLLARRAPVARGGADRHVPHLLRRGRPPLRREGGRRPRLRDPRRVRRRDLPRGRRRRGAAQALVARDADLRAPWRGTTSARSATTSSACSADRSADSLDAWSRADPAALVETWRTAFDARGRPAAIASFLDAARPCLEMIDTRRGGFSSEDGRGAHGDRRRSGLAPGFGRCRRDVFARSASTRRCRRASGPAKWPEPALYETCKSTFEGFRKLVDSTLDRLTSDDASTELAALLGVSLARARGEGARGVRGRQAEAGRLDFDDLLLITRDLLRDDDGPVRDDLARRFDLILVDEFQDTDPVQDEIVRRIAGDGLAAGRLFLVGDSKQSIYGFRGARPDLFERYHAEFPGEGRLPLTENFRSRRGVIAFVNALFADAFPRVRADRGRGCAMRSTSRSRRSRSRGPPAIEDGDRRRPQSGPCGGDLRELEAARLARLVRSWIDEGRPVRDPETGEPRPMRAQDVAFLFRTLNDSSAYERALAEEGLDYYVVGGSAFYAQGEVQDVINVLAVIDDPHDSVALAGALRSPFFGLSDDGLFWLATVRRDDLFAGLARCDEADVARPRAGRPDRMRGGRSTLLDAVAIAQGSRADRAAGGAGAGRVGLRGGAPRRVAGRPQAGQRPEARADGPRVRRAGRVRAGRLRGEAPRRPEVARPGRSRRRPPASSARSSG